MPLRKNASRAQRLMSSMPKRHESGGRQEKKSGLMQGKRRIGCLRRSGQRIGLNGRKRRMRGIKEGRSGKNDEERRKKRTRREKRSGSLKRRSVIGREVRSVQVEEHAVVAAIEVEIEVATGVEIEPIDEIEVDLEIAVIATLVGELMIDETQTETEILPGVAEILQQSKRPEKRLHCLKKNKKDWSRKHWTISFGIVEEPPHIDHAINFHPKSMKNLLHHHEKLHQLQPSNLLMQSQKPRKYQRVQKQIWTL